jgi:apolipoprotein D and lipocalin family protein
MKKLCYALSAGLLSACGHYAPMDTVAHVDLDRFMGDWYVIANIPTFIEEGAHNAVESYALNEDGSIATTFSFNEGDFSGERKTYQPTGYIVDTSSNATWGMQFIWPFRADYRIIYLDADYSLTVIAREARDYVWIMARAPRISALEYSKALDFIESTGYDVRQVRRVPQCWPQIMKQCPSQGDTI